MHHDYRGGNISELKILCELACENARVERDDVVLARHFGSGIKSESSSVNGEVAPSGIFTRQEKEELAVLRAKGFKMESSEIALGFKQGSRTLSHHLRGMCLKALYHSDWDVGQAAFLIAGHNDGATPALVRRKIERYQQGIMTKSEGANQKSLFTNLPKAYHEFLHRAIVYYQEWSAA